MEVDTIREARILATFLGTSALSIMVTLGLIVAYGSVTDGDEEVATKYINMEEISIAQDSPIAEVVDIPISDDKSIRIGLTEEYLNVNYNSLGTDAESSVMYSKSNEEISVKDIIDNVSVAQEELKREAEEAEIARARAELAKRTYSTTRTQGGLLDIQNPDPSYTGTAIRVTGADRDILERLVMGEAGNQGFEGAALVAQCIRDMYITGGFSSVESVRTNCGYSGRLTTAPNQDVLDAVSFIFDEGGYAVKHRILYFYNPAYSAGRFHESQNLIIQYKNHKFFDRWY